MLPMETQAANPNKQDLHVSEMDAEDVKKKRYFPVWGHLNIQPHIDTHLHKCNLKSNKNM